VLLVRPKSPEVNDWLTIEQATDDTLLQLAEHEVVERLHRLPLHARRNVRPTMLRAVQNGGAGEESRRFNLAAHMSAVL
jgi:hypothetical protein